MKAVHVWQSHYPWEVRVGKINRAMQSAGWELRVVARRRPGDSASETLDGVRIDRVGAVSRLFTLPVPGNPVWTHAIE